MKFNFFPLSFKFFKFICLFAYLRERDRERMCLCVRVGGQGESQADSVLSSDPCTGLEPMTPRL